jgi:hypothetical protein
VKHNSEFGEHGRAYDTAAIDSSIAMAQQAINSAYGRCNQLGLRLETIIGSYARKEARLGIFPEDISYEAAKEMQSAAKNIFRQGFFRYAGQNWNGSLADLCDYPSDIDIIVKGPSEILESLSREIYQQTFIFIAFIQPRLASGSSVPIDTVRGEGLAAYLAEY